MFQIKRKRKYIYYMYSIVSFETRFLNISGNSEHSLEMESELRLATHQQCAGGQDVMSVNKLSQNRWTANGCD